MPRTTAPVRPPTPIVSGRAPSRPVGVDLLDVPCPACRVPTGDDCDAPEPHLVRVEDAAVAPAPVPPRWAAAPAAA